MDDVTLESVARQAKESCWFFVNAFIEMRSYFNE